MAIAISIVVFFFAFWIGCYAGSSFCSDADILKYNDPLPRAYTSGDPWTLRPGDPVYLQWGEDPDERDTGINSDQRTDGYEYEFHRQSSEPAARLVQGFLRSCERNASKAVGDASSFDIRITIEDGGYYIRATIPRTHYEDDA